MAGHPTPWRDATGDLGGEFDPDDEDDMARLAEKVASGRDGRIEDADGKEVVGGCGCCGSPRASPAARATIVRAVNRFEALLSACEALLGAGCEHRVGMCDDRECFHCDAMLDCEPHAEDCRYLAATALVEAIRAGG